MRKKSIAKTYLRDVKDYQLAICEKKELNAFISVKQIAGITKPFTITDPKGRELTLMDDGHYIMVMSQSIRFL